MTNRVLDRIEKLRARFDDGMTADGQPFPAGAQVTMENDLPLSDDMRVLYQIAAEWGYETGRLNADEYETIHGAITTPTGRHGWNHIVDGDSDLATKVTVTKVCNELLEERGDA